MSSEVENFWSWFRVDGERHSVVYDMWSPVDFEAEVATGDPPTPCVYADFDQAYRHFEYAKRHWGLFAILNKREISGGRLAITRILEYGNPPDRKCLAAGEFGIPCPMKMADVPGT